MTASGWIAIDQTRGTITFGCIKTAPEQKKRGIFKSSDTTRRLELILDGALFPHLPELMAESSRIACEQPAGAQSASAASALGEVHGAFVGALWHAGLLAQTSWVAARDAKKALCGSYGASKGDMMRRGAEWLMQRQQGAADAFSTLPKYAAEAIADALGCILAAGLVK
jgi:Holliday junction resolvasome RuvABC endonuclease subunit